MWWPVLRVHASVGKRTMLRYYCYIVEHASPREIIECSFDSTGAHLQDGRQAKHFDEDITTIEYEDD